MEVEELRTTVRSNSLPGATGWVGPWSSTLVAAWLIKLIEKVRIPAKANKLFLKNFFFI